SGDVSRTQSDPAHTPETSSAVDNSLGSLPTSYKIAGGILILAVLAFSAYIFIVKPYLSARPLREALAIIERNDPAEFSQAESLLGQALIGGLRPKKVAQARFALAYVRARLGRYSEAATALAELIASGDKDRETVYLYMWVCSRLKEQEKVERLYEEHAERLGDLLDTRLMVGIAYLQRARTHWSRREVDGALHYFEQLRKLNVLVEEIPAHIEDHEVVIGIMSLFDKNPEEARKHFSGAVAAAEKHGKPALHGQLGLLLCEWIAADVPDIDDSLGKLISLMSEGWSRESAVTLCKYCNRKFDVDRSYAGKTLACTACKRRFEVEISKSSDGDAEKRDRLLSEEDLLMRNALLMHAVSLLFTWQVLPPRSGLPVREKESLLARLEKIKEVDEDMSDPYLLEGLIHYYFARDDAEREAAVEMLDRAASSGVNVPEVLNLVDREHKLAALQVDGLNRFFVLVKEYIGDQGVPESLREELKSRLERFSRFKQLGDIDLIKGEDELAPSLADIQARGMLLRKRVNTIVRPRLKEDTDDAKALKGMMEDLDVRTKALIENKESLEKAENNLLGVTGEFLLEEEESANPDQAAGEAG
ncbi:MAG TPA: tetratricopeptide repeat protein, partial [Blastocatellia bacterium]